MSNRDTLMATGEGTGVQSRAGNVCITMLEAGCCSSSHSNRGSQIESAPQKRACRKSWIEWMMIHIDVVVCVLFLGGLVASLISQGLKNHEIWGLELWKWCVLALVIVGGRRIMKWMEHCVVCLIRKIFFLLKCKVRYSYYIYSLGKYVRIFLWFGLVLLTCYLLFKSSKVKKSKFDSNVQKYIMRSLGTCVIGGFLWVLKTLLVNILTPPFQATRLFDRFRESLIDQYILDVYTKESNEVLKWVKNNRLPTEESGKVIKWLKQMESEEISAWSMKELMTVIRSPQLSSITNKLEQLAKKERDMTKLFKETEGIAPIFKSTEDGKKIYNELRTIFNGEVGDVVQHIKGTGAEGREIADQKKEGEGIEIADQKEEGEGVEIVEQKEEGEGIEIAEQKEEGKEIEIADQKEKRKGIEIGSQALRKWLVNAIVERRSLAQSLEDAERAKAELNTVVSGTVLILVFIIWLIMLGILTTGALLVLVTQFAALTFIFGDTCKSVFQGIVFVFVMHPFDVGDCCLIDKEEVVVERINLLSTVFRENMKDKIVYPNSVLTGMHIKNLDKGDRHIIRDSFEITIGSSTNYTSKTIENLISRKIGSFLKSNKNGWLLEHYLTWKEIENEKLKTILSVSYRKTDLVSDWRLLNMRRQALLRTLKNLFDEKKITCCSILPKAVDAE